MIKICALVLSSILALTPAMPAAKAPLDHDFTVSQQAESEYVYRICGRNRYETSVEISKQGWLEGAKTVVLARGDDYADALTGAPLAFALDAPILLSHYNRLADSIREEISRLGASHAVILGGEGVISPEVVAILDGMGLIVERIGGRNRYQTAEIIAGEMEKLMDCDTAMVAYGLDFPDALAAASYAAQYGYPILLTKHDELPEASKAALSELEIQDVFIIGGPSVVGESVYYNIINEIDGSVSRLSGSNRYETASALAEHFGTPSNEFYLATGLDFADAVAGGVLVAKNQGSLLLTSSKLPVASAEILLKNAPQETYLFGGTSVISEDTQNLVKKIVEPVRTFKSSELKDDFIEISFPDENTIRVTGASKAKDRILLIIDDKDGYEVAREYLQVQEDNTYSSEFNIVLADGKYSVSVYMAARGDNTYWSVYLGIPISVFNSLPSFLKPLIYLDNLIKYDPYGKVRSEHLELYLSEEDTETITNLAVEITKDKLRDYDKALAISEWVSDNIYYDMDAYYSGSYLTDVMSTLELRRSVCSGYANLTAALLRSINIPAKIVFGFALGMGTSGSWDGVYHDDPNHAWNEAYVDGRWIIIDTTWNSNNTYMDGEYYAREKDYRYFDPLILVFSYTHKIIDNE